MSAPDPKVVALTEAERARIREWVDEHRPDRHGGWGASVQAWSDLFDLVAEVADARVAVVVEPVLALRAEMVGMQNAGASLVARSWVIRKIDAAVESLQRVEELQR